MTTLTTEALARLSTWITNRMAADGTPGLSLAIVNREGMLRASAYGMAELASQTPVTPDHLFETGSIGKSFTAIALLQLADEGRIDLQAPVTEYLPWFAVQSDFEPIRLHHLLSHTAGITAGMDFAPASTVQVWGLRNLVTATPPGTHFHYSNLGYKMLGEVLQRVTGETYGPTIQSRILDPLVLVDSVPTITPDIRHRLAVGYGPLFDDRPWWPGQTLVPATWLETDTADGCLAMTAADQGTFLRMLLNRGMHEGKQILSEKGFGSLTQRAIQTEEEPDPAWYGYGIETTVVNDHIRIGHGGGMVGYFSGMIADMTTGIGAVALVNGPGSPNLIARTTLEYVNSQLNGTPFDFPAIEDADQVEGAADYIGEYEAVEGVDGPARFRIDGDGAGLVLSAPGVEARLHGYYGDFVTDTPPFQRFPMRIDRNGKQVVEITYGDTLYMPANVPPPSPASYPAEWSAYAGHYRSHNPWVSELRVVRRQARLWLILASEPDGLEAEQPLVPLADGWFRAGDDPRIPERIRFDAIVDGRAQIANLSGSEFYRVNTP